MKFRRNIKMYALFALIAITVVLSMRASLYNAFSTTSKNNEIDVSPLDYDSALIQAHKRASKDAIRLLSSYFNSKATLIKVAAGPGGTWIIHAKINNKTRKLYMLADKEHLIEGVLYSPYARTEIKEEQLEITTQPDERASQVEKLKAEFIKSVENKTAVNTGGIKAPTVPQKPTHPFKLPELNSVLSQDDKSTLFDRTKELEYIEVGEPAAPLVYVYFDFNCGGCRLTKKELAKYTDTGKLRVRYVPVGVITQESAIKAAYSLIPKNNDDRKILLDYFTQKGSAEELIKNKAPKNEVVRALSYIRDANETFFFTPKKLTPTFIFELNNEVVIANLTSEQSIRDLVERLNK